MSDYLKLKLKNYIISILPVYIYLFPVCSSVLSQRVVKYDQFSPAYFDSVRALVNDTAKENYTINAYRLSEAGEVVVDEVMVPLFSGDVIQLSGVSMTALS